MGEILCPTVIGRDHELARLTAAWASARAGRASTLFLTGEPGIGKSRLAREIVTHARRDGAAVLVGRAVPANVTVPYRPFNEALLQATRTMPAAVDETLSSWFPALDALAPPTSTRATVDGPDVPPAARSEAVLRFLGRLGEERGLLLVLEDLHWADPDSIAMLEYVADNLSSERVLCLATTRANTCAAIDLVVRLDARRSASQLMLHRLSDVDVERMIRECDPHARDDVVARVRAASDGVPLLVEDVLASPGVPTSFADTVNTRLAQLSDDERAVVGAAAVLGRRFESDLLPSITGFDVDAVCDALERGVALQLLQTGEDGVRFRHALTRDAVLLGLLPPRRRAIAARALAAVEHADPRLDGDWRDLAADLAEQAGDVERATTLLAASGHTSLATGALATAIDTFRRVLALRDDDRAPDDVAHALVEALALAGRVEEASVAGTALLQRLAARDDTAGARASVHVVLAQAAVAASRWDDARAHLDEAHRVLADAPDGGLGTRVAVLEAETALAANDPERAGRLAREALASDDPRVRCHAYEIAGRSVRLHDLPAARAAFEDALQTADDAGLGAWRLRALHELGTVDLFDHAGVERLLEARRAADRTGAISTAAVLDLQLAAVHHARYALDAAAEHERRAAAIGERMKLGEVRAKAVVFLAENFAMRGDREGMEQRMRELASFGPHDATLEAFGFGARGLLAVVACDRDAAVENLARAAGILRGVPNAEPAAFRAMWPLLAAAANDRRAGAALEDARAGGVGVISMNRGLLSHAQAVLTGRRGDVDEATTLARDAEPAFRNCEPWLHLARLWVADAALADGWGDPRRWLENAEPCFTTLGLDACARRCRELLGRPAPDRWSRLGVTARESEVLALVAQGRANKEIATALGVSPRTVEKHVESLLRKTGARSRTHLAAMATTYAPS